MNFKGHMREFEKYGDIKIIEKFISDKNIVFDVGANIGAWSKAVLDRFPNVNLHLFEPIGSCSRDCSKLFKPLIKTRQFMLNCTAVSDVEVIRDFCFYPRISGLSTFYKRNEKILKWLHLDPPKIIKVPTITLDNYCKRLEIPHVHFLKIDVEGAEFDVLKGTSKLLTEKRIDYIQFEYGGCFEEVGITLQSVFNYMQSKGYTISKFDAPNRMLPIKQFSPPLEDYKLCNFLATSPRIGK